MVIAPLSAVCSPYDRHVHPDHPELRLSDSERQEALDALGEHLGNGRLDLDEFSDRSARVAAARTRGELVEFFTDLPDPHPSVLKSTAPARIRNALDAPPPRTAATWLASSAVPIAAVIAVVLFLTVARFWAVFLIPVAAALLVGALYGRGDQGSSSR